MLQLILGKAILAGRDVDRDTPTAAELGCQAVKYYRENPVRYEREQRGQSVKLRGKVANIAPNGAVTLSECFEAFTWFGRNESPCRIRVMAHCRDDRYVAALRPGQRVRLQGLLGAVHARRRCADADSRLVYTVHVADCAPLTPTP